MLDEVSFMSLERVLALAPNQSTIVVSITDSSPLAVRPSLEGYRDVLRLEFVDITEEDVGAVVGSWPSEPTTEEHEQISGLRGERLPAVSDAEAVRDFLYKHHLAPERVSVLVHCFAGASRSAAVARWAAATYDIPLDDVAGRGTSQHNKRLSRLLESSLT